VAGRIERQLAALRDLPEDEGAASAVLEKALDSGSGLVVADGRADRSGRAATRVCIRCSSERTARWRAEDGKTDPGCGGRAAIVEALAEGEQRAWHVYRIGVWRRSSSSPYGAIPPHEDTAGELRARSLLALVHTGYAGALDLAAEALADPLARVRVAAATAHRRHRVPWAAAPCCD
jgi:hypothetical protein